MSTQSDRPPGGNVPCSLPKVTLTQACRALGVLARYGRQRFAPDATVGFAECVGLALAKINDPGHIAPIAKAMFEDWNAHLAVAAIDAIECHKGKATRSGRKLEIILPKHWADT